jgi:hypothetical protein
VDNPNGDESEPCLAEIRKAAKKIVPSGTISGSFLSLG